LRYGLFGFARDRTLFRHTVTGHPSNRHMIGWDRVGLDRIGKARLD
jgi:hypothetical protein